MDGRVAMIVALLYGIVLVAMTPAPGQAQNTPDDFLASHNDARAQVGVGEMVWDDTVAAYAESYASQRAGDCAMMHSEGSGYGENLFSGSGKEYSAADAVASWVSENQWYDYDSNTCSAPAGDSCGHYTQVVWSDSVSLGCARVTCDNGSIFITCNYSPPGNYVGQRPY